VLDLHVEIIEFSTTGERDKIMKAFALATVALAVVVSTPASAANFIGATTLASPTYNRPLAGTPPVSLSAVGTAVHYQTVAFTVGTTGSYTFLMSALVPAGWDTFLSLYSNSFNPALSLTNILVSNDDNPTIGLSGFTINLTAGTSYFAVATGFGNNDVGTYNLAITGPGTVNFPAAAGVPEPATWAMMLLGFGGVGFAMRRRSVTTRVRFV
jgi:hypothetical protein